MAAAIGDYWSAGMKERRHRRRGRTRRSEWHFIRWRAVICQIRETVCTEGSSLLWCCCILRSIFKCLDKSAIPTQYLRIWWILYLSLQAVSRHSCMELLNVHESEIQSAISENNLEEADLKPKIRRLDRINKLLAHRPWAIKRHHIKVSIQ